MEADYNGVDRRKVDIEKIQKEAAERARLEMTLESMQRSIETLTTTVGQLANSNAEKFQSLETKLEDQRRDQEEAHRREFDGFKNTLAFLQERLDPVEKDYLKREKEKQEAEKAAKDRVEHGKRVAIGVVVSSGLAILGGFSLWLFNLWQTHK